jgi:hypothetical protein
MTKVDKCPGAEAPGEVLGFGIRHSFVPPRRIFDIGYFVPPRRIFDIRHYTVASMANSAL